LAALPPDEVERLLPTFQQISFSLGDVVYDFSEHLDYVYFPTTAIISLLYTMENGATAEMGLTGNDGVVGKICGKPAFDAYSSASRRSVSIFLTGLDQVTLSALISEN
jgi:hypothetical protein